MAVLGGAGAMGRAAVFDLARQGLHVRLLDADAEAAHRIVRLYSEGLADISAPAASDVGLLARSLEGAAVVVNAAPYRLNLAVMEAALRAGCHYVDLGGLFHTTRRQLRLHDRFRERGLLAVLGMGSAPGIVNVLARAAVDRLRKARSIRIYNGSLDQTRSAAPVAFAFSPATVLDEMTQSPVVFTKGRYRTVPPRSGGEDFAFEIGTQRVHLSLHSEAATLPQSFAAKGVRECAFKIAYDPALLERLKLLIALGLTDPNVGALGVAPRDVLLDCFRRLPRPPAFVDDRDSLAVVVEGSDERGEVVVRHDLTATPQRRPPLSAVARDTGFPPAIVARMLIEGQIAERGALPPERCVPVRPFLTALAERGLTVHVSERRPALGPR